MRRRLIIVGTLIIAILLVLGACAPSATPTPKSTPTPAPKPELVPKTASIYYDDGKEDGWASQGRGWGYAVRYSPPAIPFTIDRVKLLAATNSENNSFNDTALLEIWDENLEVIYSHELPFAEFSTKGDWIALDPKITVKGDFRVVFYTKSNKSDGIYSAIFIGFDSSSENKHSEDVRSGGRLADWPTAMEKTKPQATTQWMIRVIGTYMAPD